MGGSQVAIDYQLNDQLWMRGPFAAAGGSYQLPILQWLALFGRAEMGVVFTATSDDLQGEARTSAG